MTKKLQKQITNKLESLEKVIDKIRNKTIEPDNSEMWDSSYYYDLAAKLKEALNLLQDQKSKQLDDWGKPLILETGICSLLDDWETGKEEKDC